MEWQSFGGVRTFSHHQSFFREWIRKSFPVDREGLTVLKSILLCWWWEIALYFTLFTSSYTSDTGSEAVEISDIEADFATGAGLDTWSRWSQLKDWKESKSCTWSEECEEREIVSRLGASLLALDRSFIWTDAAGIDGLQWFPWRSMVLVVMVVMMIMMMILMT